jgi:hypothetical protein
MKSLERDERVKVTVPTRIASDILLPWRWESFSKLVNLILNGRGR